MTETPPETPEPGVLHRAEEWVRNHVAPDLAAVKADAERFREAAPELQSLAETVVTLAKAVAPSAAPEVAAAVTIAEKAAGVLARIAAELAASGM